MEFPFRVDCPLAGGEGSSYPQAWGQAEEAFRVVLRVRKTDLFVLNMRTRMPFRYGIATLVALPHLFVKIELELDAGGGPIHRLVGLSADHLPPKWFTKQPHTKYADDIAEMIDVIRSACGIAQKLGPMPTVFQLWRELYAQQGRWGVKKRYPPLLWGFGVSLLERAVIDAFCRGMDHSFATALRENTLGIELGQIHPELAGGRPSDLLPAAPLTSIIVRHTIGIGDPLTDSEIPLRERLHDGLPQSLETAIRTYGLTHFKIKLSGQSDKDLHRLRDLARFFALRGEPAAFTLDANESYQALEPFQQLWRQIVLDPPLQKLFSRLLFIEQPLHRSVALSDETFGRLLAWPDRPRMIIDESDDRIESICEALAGGYVGASHKNCKGVIKGIATACLIQHRNRNGADGRWIISAEDLSNVGPVALPQDLAVVASLGIPHAERNGHHYFRGLSAIPRGIQHELLDAHRDLYRDHDDGFATVNINHGVCNISSVISHGFGLRSEFDPAVFIPLDQWDPASLNG
jgi:hypothetical protein